MKTLVHDPVTTYYEFTRILLYRFERKDPKISFREIAHVKKNGTPKAYIFEFQKLVVMVPDILESCNILILILLH